MRMRRCVARVVCLLSMVALYPTAAGSVPWQKGPPPPADPRRSSVSDRVAEEMLRLARVKSDDVVYFLGSSETVLIMRKAALAAGVSDRVRFVEGDLMTAGLGEATVVILDLSPDQNLRLEPILRRMLRPGTRIVSHRYGIGAWRADETSPGSDGTTLFLWTVPRLPARTPDIFFVPTPQPIIERMLQLAGVTANDTVYDLGSGDGRIVVVAAQKYGARGVGVEIDPALVGISRQVARDAGLESQVRFVEADLFNVDLAEATVVTLFLSHSTNRRLEAKLKRELRDGARVVSRQFDMGEWAPDLTVRAEDGTSLYLWTIRR